MEFKVERTLPVGEVFYKSSAGDIITEKEFIQEFLNKCNYNYTPDERLDYLIENITHAIRDFEDSTQYEIDRTQVKDADGSLQRILKVHTPAMCFGYNAYEPIKLDEPENYKQFFFILLSYCLVFYEMFYDGAEYEIVDSGVKVGSFGIERHNLPHMLGFENDYVSRRDNYLLEQIMPGYNAKRDAFSKMRFLIDNCDKLIAYEKSHNVDLLNYCKCMSKCKQFLMMGRVFADSDSYATGKNKFAVLKHITPRGEVQFHLLKKSNMNSSVTRNVAKVILQESNNKFNNCFAKSLQGFTDKLLRSHEYMELIKKNPGMVTVNGVSAHVSYTNQLKIDISSPGKTWVRKYYSEVNAPLREINEQYNDVVDLFDYLGVECDSLAKFKYKRDDSDGEVVEAEEGSTKSKDDIEVLLDEEEDFHVNFDKYMREMLDDMFSEINVIPEEEKGIHK